MRTAANSFNHSYNFELPNKSNEFQRHGTSTTERSDILAKTTWCATIWTWKMQKEISSHRRTSPNKKRSLCSKVKYWSLGLETKHTRIQCSSVTPRPSKKRNCKSLVGNARKSIKELGETCKEELQQWDAQMSERRYIQEYREPCKQSANVALPVKQHTEYHLAVTDCQRTWAETEDSRVVTPCRKKSNKHNHLLRRRLNGMAGGRVRGEMSRGSGLKDSHHDGYVLQLKWLRWSTFSGHPSGRWKHPHRTSHICHLLAPPVFFHSHYNL